jgi:hypothetical protein
MRVWTCEASVREKKSRGVGGVDLLDFGEVSKPILLE